MHSKKIPSDPRYKRTRNIAHRFLLNQGINSLPVDPFELVEKNSWTIKNMAQLSKEFDLSLIRKIIKESNDGGTLYSASTNEYCIIYNEKIRSNGRIRWTVTHEIGHIVLGHLEDFPETCISRQGISNNEYEILEKEADYFTAYVLAPPIVLYHLKLTSVSQIQNICMLSKLASENRLKHQTKWNQHPYIDNFAIRVILNFYGFIYGKQCPECGYGFVSKNAIYCPICGSNISWGRGKMIYNGYELDENGRAIICPVCDNEQISGGGFCKICGANIVNKCTNVDSYNGEIQWECGTFAEGNARFCIECGYPTTFGKAKILKEWREELEETPAFEDDIPFEDDDLF